MPRKPVDNELATDISRLYGGAMASILHRMERRGLNRIAIQITRNWLYDIKRVIVCDFPDVCKAAIWLDECCAELDNAWIDGKVVDFVNNEVGHLISKVRNILSKWDSEQDN